jgi:hypothetical protein
MKAYFDARAVARERFIHTVIHHFENHVVEACAVVRVTDIHPRALAHGVEAFEDLDVL